jgi:hypothetical protein
VEVETTALAQHYIEEEVGAFECEVRVAETTTKKAA